MFLWLVASKGVLAEIPRLMPLGDSITAGWNQPSYRMALSRALEARGCEVDLVGNQILTSRAAQTPHRFPGFHFPSFSPATHPEYNPEDHWDPESGDDTDHAGYPGATSSELLKMVWAEVRVAQPDYILLHVGTSDVLEALSGRTREEWAEFAIKTVSKINEITMAIYSSHKHPQNARILLANLIPAKPTLRDKEWLNEFQLSKTLSRYITVFVKGKNDPRLTLVDVASGFDVEQMTTDGIHPNLEGEQHIANAFLTALLDSGLCSQ